MVGSNDGIESSDQDDPATPTHLMDNWPSNYSEKKSDDTTTKQFLDSDDDAGYGFEQSGYHDPELLQPDEIPKNDELPTAASGIRRIFGMFLQSFKDFETSLPRLFALLFGFFLPMFALVMVALVCGYPLAYLESPLEVDQNDSGLESQLRLLIDTSMYTNITQSLPRVCLALYFMNSSADEFVANLSLALTDSYNLDQVQDDLDDTNITVDVELDVNVDVDANQDLATDTNFTVITNFTTEDNTTTTISTTISGNATPTNEMDLDGDGDADIDIEEDLPIQNRTQLIVLQQVRQFIRERAEAKGNPFSDYLQFWWDLQDISESYQRVINVTDLMAFVDDCGAGLTPIIDRMFLDVTNTSGRASSSTLNFAWTRCPIPPNFHAYETMDDMLRDAALILSPTLSSLILNNTHAFQQFFSTDPQAIYYRRQWELDRRRLYQKYLQEEIQRGEVLASSPDLLLLDEVLSEDGATEPHEETVTSSEEEIANATLLQKRRAFERSIKEATGGKDCRPNIPASAWFWFTVMTTIGYGNSSPVSFGGRAMVFTLGFVTILCFGMVSARAGQVISSLLEDFLRRYNLRIFMNTYAECFLWGGLYYVWMVAIAAHYNHRSIGSEGTVKFSTAYWFSYISTTTIGFGDYYLAPNVITTSDCIVFPIMFLLGFSFLASFIGKLTVVVRYPFAKDGPSLVETFHQADERNASETPRNTDATARGDKNGNTSDLNLR